MTIEIHQPELEALIRDRMASGHFASVEELLLCTLEPSATTSSRNESPGRTGAEIIAAMPRMPYKDEIDLEPMRPILETTPPPVSPSQNGRKLSLDEVFGLVRGLADDVDFSRDRSFSRPLDLSE